MIIDFYFKSLGGSLSYKKKTTTTTKKKTKQTNQKKPFHPVPDHFFP